MKKYLVVTIDVEPDCTPNWTYSSPLTFKGVETGIAQRLHPLFRKYNIIPTYLINNVVLEDSASAQILKSIAGTSELGTHLHPEFIEPEKKFHDYAGKKGEANCCFYQPEIEFQKIKGITELFTRNFGHAPQSFRAGRFSAGKNTIKSLIDLNYKVDTSVTPNVRWDDHTRERAVDFRAASNQPYFIDERSIVESSTPGKLLEIPVTIVRKKLTAVGYLKYIKNKKRIPYKGSKAVWLRPVFSTVEDYKNIITQVTREHHGRDVMVYNMMFHNVEVMPGLSPYTRTEEDCKLYMQSLEELFKYCNAQGIESIAAASLYDIYR